MFQEAWNQAVELARFLGLNVLENFALSIVE